MMRKFRIGKAVALLVSIYPQSASHLVGRRGEREFQLRAVSPQVKTCVFVFAIESSHPSFRL